MIAKPDHMTEAQWAKLLEYVKNMHGFNTPPAQPQQPTGNQS